MAREPHDHAAQKFTRTAQHERRVWLSGARVLCAREGDMPARSSTAAIPRCVVTHLVLDTAVRP